MRTSFTCLAAVSSFVLAFSVSPSAHAKTGYSSGYTGAPGSKSCGGCHKGGAATTLSVTGPSTLAAGQTGDYTATLTGGPGNKSFGASVSSGTIAPVSGNIKTAGTEVFSSHTSTATGTYQFKITAPASGSVTLYYMGLASDGSGTGGDDGVELSKTITVMGGTPSVDAGTPSKDGGVVMPSEDGGAPAVDEDGGIVDPTPATIPGSDDTGSTLPDDNGAVDSNSGMKSGDGVLPSNEEPSCSFTTGGVTGGPLSGAPLLLTAVGLLLARRRRPGS